MKTIAQVVQHLSPGGIEVMALELKRHAQKGIKTKIISLEGNWEDASTKWPRLRALENDLIFLDKKDLNQVNHNCVCSQSLDCLYF